MCCFALASRQVAELTSHTNASCNAFSIAPWTLLSSYDEEVIRMAVVVRERGNALVTRCTFLPGYALSSGVRRPPPGSLFVHPFVPSHTLCIVQIPVFLWRDVSSDST